MPLDFMLAKEYTDDMKAPRNTKDYNPPEGWLMSEKLDGYRARYNPDTHGFISRQNKPFNAPEWFLNAISFNSSIHGPMHFDGELFAGRDHFQGMGVVRKKIPVDEEWFKIKYYVYDLPDIDETFEKRYDLLKTVVSEIENGWSKFVKDDSKFKDVSCPIVLCEHYKVDTMDQMKEFYKSVLDNGGEGIMLKDPECKYENKRSNYLLKYKPNFDAEAVVVDYKDGTKKYEGMLGSFVCKPLINHGNHMTIDNDENHEFATSGMNDSVRESYKETHPIGTIITYEYSGYTKSGKPRFARYIRIRDDVIIKETKKQKMDIDTNENVKKCIEIFKRLGVYEKANGQPFKASAYKKAIDGMRNMKDSDLTPETLIQVKGIGKSLIEKIQTIVQTGTLEQYEKIKDFKDPREIFMDIHGIGSVKAGELVKAGFKSIQELRDNGDIKEYLNDVQMKGLKWYDDCLERIPRDEIVNHETYLKKVLYNIDSEAELTIAGSFRRGKAHSGDIDMLINTPSVKNNSIYKKFIDELFKQGYLVEELSRGQKKFMGMGKLGIESLARRIDIMYTKPVEYPFAILYFTGSMEFNVKMRAELLEKGLSLNEYGIKAEGKNVKHGCKTEKNVFEYLGYDYVEPENR